METFNFHFSKVIEHVRALETTDDKIRYLIEIKSEYEIYRQVQLAKQSKSMIESFMGAELRNNTFSNKCDAVIVKLKTERELGLTNEFDIITSQLNIVGGFVNFATRHLVNENSMKRIEEFFSDDMIKADVLYSQNLATELAKHNNPEMMLRQLEMFLIPYIDKYLDWYNLNKNDIVVNFNFQKG